MPTPEQPRGLSQAQACASQGGSQVAPCMAACCMATEERPPIPPAAIACLALYEPWVRHWPDGGYHSMVGAWAASAKYALHAVIQAVWEEYEWTAYCGHCHFLFRIIMHCEFCGGQLRCAQQLWPDVFWRIKLRYALETTLCHRSTRPRRRPGSPFYVARTPPSESESTWSHGSGRPGSQSASPPFEATIPVWVGDDNGWDPD